jgi:NADH-quinone oxidoreductase subunit K
VLLKEMLSATTLLFFTGVVGVVLNRKNIIITFMSLELMLLAVNLNFLSFSLMFDDIVGQVFVLFILTIAATESAIGLSLLILLHNQKSAITYDPVTYECIILPIREKAGN